MEGTGTGGHGGSEYTGDADTSDIPYASIGITVCGSISCHGYTALPYYPGDGSFQTYDITVPWSSIGTNQIVIEPQLTAFGRIWTQGQTADVNFASDFSDTASLTGVSLFDAAGNDITSLSTISFLVPTTSTTPEPGSLALLGGGVLALGFVSRKRQR
jgi:hypothetical protein